MTNLSSLMLVVYLGLPCFIFGNEINDVTSTNELVYYKRPSRIYTTRVKKKIVLRVSQW